MHDYPSLFRSRVVNGLRATLAQITPNDYLLDRATRERALHLLSYAFNVESAWPLTCDLLLVMASKMEQEGYREEWMAYLERGLRESEAQGNVAARATLNLHLGFLQRLRGNLPQAHITLQASAADFARLGDREQWAKASNRLAYVMLQQGQQTEATQLAEQTLATTEWGSPQWATSHAVVGAIAVEKQEWTTACTHFQMALAIWERAQNLRMIAWSLGDLGIAQGWLQHYADATIAFQRAIEILDAIHDPVQLAATRMNFGIVYMQQECFADALQLFALAEPTLRQVQDELRLAKLYNNQGYAHRRLEQWREAEQSYQLSIAYWRKLGNLGSLINVLDGLAVVYTYQGAKMQLEQTLQEVFALLPQIKNSPSYERLRQMVMHRLDQAQEQFVHLTVSLECDCQMDKRQQLD